MLLRSMSLVAVILLASPAWAANEPVLIAWPDLIPAPDEPTIPRGLIPDEMAPDTPASTPYDPTLGGVVPHGGMVPGMPGAVDQNALVTRYDDVRVRIAGFVLPIALDGTVVREFLLVPYVGACIHVPPPPPNQIIYVTSDEGIEVTGMFEPVWATGILKTTSMSSDLAEIGYLMTLDEATPYEF